MAKLKVTWLEQPAEPGMGISRTVAVVGRNPVGYICPNVLDGSKTRYEINLPIKSVPDRVGQSDSPKEAKAHVESQVRAWFERCGL